jgi:hypothetical protein
MPLVDNKLPVLFGKVVCPRELPHSQAKRFAKLDTLFHDNDSFAAAIANMNVNGSMFVAVEEKPITILFEDFWHRQYLR